MLSEEEGNQLDRLQREFSENFISYDWGTMEEFAELFAKSLKGKGDSPPGNNSSAR